MAWPIVLHAAVGDLQLLLSFPLTPFTYHVAVLAMIVGARVKNSAKSSKVLIVNLCFITFPFAGTGNNTVASNGASRLSQSGQPVPCQSRLFLGFGPMRTGKDLVRHPEKLAE